MATVDLTVRGAGVFGLACAWEAARRGARVRVVDPGGPGAGASGGVVGALAPHTPDGWNDKKAFQRDALLMAEAFWAGADAASGLSSGYGRTGRLQPLADARAADRARARTDDARTRWLGRAEWRIVPAANCEDWLPVPPTGLAILDTLSARLHPARAVASLAAALRARGAEIAAEGPDEGAVLHATGHAGLATLSRAFGRPLGSGVKGQALVLAHDARDRPQLYVDGLHVVPHADGTTAVGSTSERDWADPDGTDGLLDAIHARALAACPALAAAPVLSRWAGVRPRAATRAPLLGPWPGRAAHFVANGGFKIGFGLAPKVAEVMADLILEGRDAAIPAAFRLETALGA